MLADLKGICNYEGEFTKFMQSKMNEDETFKFWGQFVLLDCNAYVSLFLAVRTGNWKLRIAAVKSMAALFTAFDRQKYQKLISQHIVDLLRLSSDTIAKLDSGGFTVSLKGRPCHSLAIDEAHEMCINKDCKQYITRPSADYINRTALFIPVRAEGMKNLENEIFPDKKSESEKSIHIFTIMPDVKKFEENVQNQMKKLNTSSLKTQLKGDGLQHIFNKKSLTAEQVHDLLSFRDIGQTEFETAVEYYTIRKPSVQPPKHRKQILTFTEKRSKPKKASVIEKERKLQIECWKKRVAFAISTGAQIQDTYEQCIELPRAIATSEGTPNKGTKSNITNSLEKRYQQATPPVILQSLPPTWVPNTVIMEGMFLINIKPWIAHKNFGDYANFLIKQHVLPFFRGGSQEVHIIFDDPEHQGFSPKYFEREQRNKVNLVPDNHNCTDFSSDMTIPPKWRENVLNCRTCKRNLVCFLSNHFVHEMKSILQSGQKFVTAGGFNNENRDKAIFVCTNTTPQSDAVLQCNAEEADTRIWLHAVHSAGKKKLVLSPDTDVYHIGLPIVAQTDFDVLVRLSKFNAVEHKLLDVQALIHAFTNDPELAHIPSHDLPSLIQVLFVCSGCDFISFFNGLGKASFLATLLEYSNFICANNEKIAGTLAEANSHGKLPFLRLIGCAYYRKHRAAFLPTYPSPVTLYNSIKEGDHNTHHSKWLHVIRERIWSRIKFEEDMIPSDGALERHWLRTCWVLAIWRQACSNNIIYLPLNGNGWKQLGPNTLEIDWDSEDNLAHVRINVALIQKGCGCKTGCTTARCKCRRRSTNCGPGCKCQGCQNLLTTPTASLSSAQLSSSAYQLDILESSDSCESQGEDSDLETEVNQIMYNVFGLEEESDSDMSRDDL